MADPLFTVMCGVDLVGGADSRGSYVSKILCVETKESGPLGAGHSPGTPLDPPKWEILPNRIFALVCGVLILIYHILPPCVGDYKFGLWLMRSHTLEQTHICRMVRASGSREFDLLVSANYLCPKGVIYIIRNPS